MRDRLFKEAQDALGALDSLEEKYGAIKGGKTVDGVPEDDLLDVSKKMRAFMKDIDGKWMPAIEEIQGIAKKLGPMIPDDDDEGHGGAYYVRHRRHIAGMRHAASNMKKLTTKLYRNSYKPALNAFNDVMATWGMTDVVNKAKSTAGEKPDSHDLANMDGDKISRAAIVVSKKLQASIERTLDNGLKVARLLRDAAKAGEISSSDKTAIAKAGGAFQKSISLSFYKGPLGVLKLVREWLKRIESYSKYEDYDKLYAIGEAVSRDLSDMLDLFEDELNELVLLERDVRGGLAEAHKADRRAIDMAFKGLQRVYAGREAYKRYKAGDIESAMDELSDAAEEFESREMDDEAESALWLIDELDMLL